MKRLAHLSDSHFDERGRLDDVRAVHGAFIRQAAEAKVDLIVHAGDLYERRSTPLERLAAVDFLIGAATVAPVFVVKGNHDQSRDIELFNTIHAHNRIAAVELVEWGRLGLGGFAPIALPWFDKAHLAGTLGPEVDAETTRQAAIVAAESMLSGIRAMTHQAQQDGLIPILVSHALVAGSEVSTGQTLIGIGVEFSPNALLETGVEYVALGHVHKTQEWLGGRVCYSGSPARHNFGEMEEKGWRLVEFDDAGRFVSNTFMPLPAREMRHIDLDFRTADDVLQIDLSGWSPFSGCKGALVRVRYYTTAELLPMIDRAILEKGALAAGAAEVQVEAVVEPAVRQRARSAETAAAITPAEKLTSYLEAKRIEADRDRLLAKLDTLRA